MNVGNAARSADAAATDPRSTMEQQPRAAASSADRTPVVTLTLAIGEALDISVHSDPGGRDMRARWDRVKWLHYSYLADGICDLLGSVLEIPRKEVRTNGSLLCTEVTAKPRLLVEIPAKYRERAMSEDVQSAIRRLAARIRGEILEPAAIDAAATASSVRVTHKAGECVVPMATLTSQAEASVLHDAKVDIVATRLLNKVGGATLPFQCSIAMVGAPDSLAEVGGRCADKPKPPSLPPEEVSFSCFVDGFSRSRHVVFLVECDKDGTAREVAMPVEWIERVADHARLKDVRFFARVKVVKGGGAVRRDLLDLQLGGVTSRIARNQDSGVS